MLAAWIGGALVLGLVARAIGLPPLVGFLAAGFFYRGTGMESTPMLDELAHAGVLMLLFAVGLKLRPRTLFSVEVLGTALLHLAVIAGAGLLLLGAGSADWAVGVALAVALGFSSTVFAAKVLEDKRELRGVHGRIAIGILIVQDIVAVGLLAALNVGMPSPYALVLLLLPVLRMLLSRLLDIVGHGELLVLFGMVLAISVGGHGFELVGLSPELGALVLGMLLSDHKRAHELSIAIWSLKEFFLIGFFLRIGLGGDPTWEVFQNALVLLALLPVKVILLFLVLVAIGLRARTSFLTSVSLATYSEFGLIVGKAAVDAGLLGNQWLVAGAIAVALSFVVAAPLNLHAHPLFARLARLLIRFERDKRHPDDEPVTLGSAEYFIVGMGRVGTGAYDFLRTRSDNVVGCDSDPDKVGRHLREGRRVVYADAEDPSFWHRLNTGRLEGILLALPDLEAKLIAARELRRAGYRGFLSATHVFPEERGPITKAGCDATYNYFTEAGVGFARDSWQNLQEMTGNPVTAPPQGATGPR